MNDAEKIKKLREIIELEIGWATPRDLIETIKREVLDK